MNPLNVTTATAVTDDCNKTHRIYGTGFQERLVISSENTLVEYGKEDKEKENIRKESKGDRETDAYTGMMGNTYFRLAKG